MGYFHGNNTGRYPLVSDTSLLNQFILSGDGDIQEIQGIIDAKNNPISHRIYA
jgi:hypothetical protein